MNIRTGQKLQSWVSFLNLLKLNFEKKKTLNEILETQTRSQFFLMGSLIGR